jgi:enoyl-CoA hydratase/carnithine racemase
MLTSLASLVRVERQERIWTFVLNRPDKRNALNAEMVEALLAGLAQAMQTPQVPMLVFRGEGKSFCAGFDFADVEQQSDADLLWRFVRIEQLLQQIYHWPALTLGLAQGKNFGAGVDLWLACQHRVAATDASFRMPGLKFGLLLGTRRLGHLIGMDQARRIQEVAATIDVAQAQTLGLITQCTEPGQWPDTIATLAQTSIGLDAATRASLNAALTTDTRDLDLADVVRSLTRPGLKARIAKYRAGG